MLPEPKPVCCRKSGPLVTASKPECRRTEATYPALVQCRTGATWLWNPCPFVVKPEPAGYRTRAERIMEHPVKNGVYPGRQGDDRTRRAMAWSAGVAQIGRIGRRRAIRLVPQRLALLGTLFVFWSSTPIGSLLLLLPSPLHHQAIFILPHSP